MPELTITAFLTQARRRPRRALGRAASVTACAVVAGLAAAPICTASVVMGSAIDFQGQTLPVCLMGGACVSVLDALPPRITRAPLFVTPDGRQVDHGVIVRWRIRGHGTFSFAPVRYTGDDVIVVPRWPGSEQRTVPDNQQVNWYPTRVPIRTGESVALYVAPDSRLYTWWNEAAADTDYWKQSPPLMQERLADYRDSHWEEAWNVVVETDRDGDGYGDETQDDCPDNATTHGSCPAPPPAPPSSPPPPSSAPAPTPAASPGRDVVAPIITGTIVRRGRIEFVVSEPATISVRVRRRRSGRYARLRTITRHVALGANAIRTRTRRRGRYRATIVAIDAAGNQSHPLSLRFRVKRSR